MMNHTDTNPALCSDLKMMLQLLRAECVRLCVFYSVAVGTVKNHTFAMVVCRILKHILLVFMWFLLEFG